MSLYSDTFCLSLFLCSFNDHRWHRFACYSLHCHATTYYSQAFGKTNIFNSDYIFISRHLFVTHIQFNHLLITGKNRSLLKSHTRDNDRCMWFCDCWRLQKLWWWLYHQQLCLLGVLLGAKLCSDIHSTHKVVESLRNARAHTHTDCTLYGTVLLFCPYVWLYP